MFGTLGCNTESKEVTRVYENIGRQLASGGDVRLYLDQKNEIETLHRLIHELHIEFMELKSSRSKRKRVK